MLTLLGHDLVDELCIKINSMALGGSKRLIEKSMPPAAFKVTESTVTPKGIAFVNYERTGAVATGRHSEHSHRHEP